MLGALIGGAASLAGGLLNNNAQAKNAAADRKAQKEYAQNSVQWRAADAKSAGLHPLATMGYSGSSYTPVGGGSGMGTAVSQAGQQIGAAMSASPKNKLAQQLGASSMAVDAANVELLQAQKLQILDGLRKSQQGIKPSMTSLPSPGKTTPVIVGGKQLPHDKTTSDAESWEQRYGDVAQEIGGAITAYQDFVKPKMKVNVNRMSKADREKLSWLEWLIPQISYKAK